MTDELTPEQEAAVRRLLSEARHDQPVPAEVAARLDEVLDGLVADEGVDDLEVFESDRAGSVTDLAGARRRRRNAGRLILAAAAVVIGGVAIGQALGGTGLDAGGDDAGSADSSLAEAPREGTELAEPESQSRGRRWWRQRCPAPEPAEADLLDQVRAPLSAHARATSPPTSSASWAGPRPRGARRPNAGFDGVVAYTAANSDFVCAAATYGEGATLPAYYDAEEAVLVLRRPRAGIQRVDLLTCGTAVPLNSVDLPAP